MGIRLLALVLLLAPRAVLAGDLPGVPERPGRLLAVVHAGGGAALPAGGHWGDPDSGFKPSPSFFLAAARPLDELLSAGLESSFNTRHAWRGDGGRRMSLLALTPFVRADLPGAKADYHALFGAGLYYWEIPGFTSGGARYGGGSGSAFGFNLGAGLALPLSGEIMAGLELRWHHLFNLEGNGLDLNSADNLNLLFTLSLPLRKGP